MNPLCRVLLALLLATGVPAAANTDNPNIIVLLTDQWRASAMGYIGDPNVQTPNIDRLAKQALDFRNSVSVCPVCTPYRASVMTGRSPSSTGMFLNDAYLPDSELCMAEIFGDAGYDTAYIGKWHLDGHGRAAFIPSERRQGWQYWKAAECDHTYPRSHYYTGDSDEKLFWDGYDAFAQTKDARLYLQSPSRREKPFVLFLSYGPPHFPHDTAPAEFKALYPIEKIKLPANVPPEQEADARREIQGYYAHCTALDRCVGDLLATLEETGLAKRTILVFTSDHGEMMGSHGVAPRTKQVPWNESAQVPFLLRVPGVPARAVATPITTPDILPTLLGLANVKIPATIEGQNLSPLIRSGAEQERAVLYMNVAPFGNPELSREYRAIRTRQHTYVRGIDGPWLLFDNQRDPLQQQNLIGQQEHAVLAKALDQDLQARLKEIGDVFRPAAEHLAEWGYQVKPHGSVPYGSPDSKPQSPRRQQPPGTR